MRRAMILAALALFVAVPAASAAQPIRGTAGDDTLAGTAQADKILARGGDDTVTAGDGDDRVYGGQGEDTIDGGAGDDTINARGDGGKADTITCGDGEDTVHAGRGDEVADDCETVKRPGPKSPEPTAGGETEAGTPTNAAKTCKALRTDDADAFAERYGTKPNAFGKCVSATAKAGDAAA